MRLESWISAIIVAALVSVGACGSSRPGEGPEPSASGARSEPPRETEEALIEGARALLDEAIGLLARREYRDLLIRTTAPHVLERLRAEGRFEAVVQRFEDGWGDRLLAKIEDARWSTERPTLREDGAVVFTVSGPQLGAEPIVSIAIIDIDGTMYFTE